MITGKDILDALSFIDDDLLFKKGDKNMNSNTYNQIIGNCKNLQEVAMAYPNAFLQIQWFFTDSVVTEDFETDEEKFGTKITFDTEYSFTGWCKNFLIEKKDYDCLMDIEPFNIKIIQMEKDLLIFRVHIYNEDSDNETYINDEDDINKNDVVIF